MVGRPRVEVKPQGWDVQIHIGPEDEGVIDTVPLTGPADNLLIIRLRGPTEKLEETLVSRHEGANAAVNKSGVPDEMPEEPDPAAIAPAAVRLGRTAGYCVPDILVHLRQSDDRNWTDIITAVSDLGYDQRNVAKWLKWLIAEGWVRCAGKGKPYEIVEKD